MTDIHTVNLRAQALFVGSQIDWDHVPTSIQQMQALHAIHFQVDHAGVVSRVAAQLNHDYLRSAGRISSMFKFYVNAIRHMFIERSGDATRR